MTPTQASDMSASCDCAFCKFMGALRAESDDERRSLSPLGLPTDKDEQ